jgi:transcription elongation factor Elf1
MKKQKNEPEREERILTCPECGKGEIKILDIIGKTFHVCQCCGYRKKVNG